MVLPRLPKELRSVGARTPADASRLVDEWARGQQDLTRALREGHPSILSRLDDLEARPVGGGSSVSYGAHVDLTVGGAGTDGANTTVSRSDHVHGLPSSRTAAGEFAEGAHTHDGLGSGYVEVWNPYLAPATVHAADDMMDNGTTIDAKWTIHDPSACIDTIDATSYARRYYVSKTGAHNGIGLRQSFASVGGTGSFSMVVRVSNLDDCYCAGLAVGAGTGNQDNYRIVGQGLDASTGGFVRTSEILGTRVTDGTTSAVSRTWGVVPWYRMRGNIVGGACTVASDCSVDGEHWHRLTGQTGLALAVDFNWFGVMIHGPNGTTSKSVFSNFSFVWHTGAAAAAFDYQRPGQMSRVAVT